MTFTRSPPQPAKASAGLSKEIQPQSPESFRDGSFWQQKERHERKEITLELSDLIEEQIHPATII
jgi:hypothetical protein